MTDRRVECPGCRAELSVPDDLTSRKVRCSFCKTVFDVSKPRRVIVQDDMIAGWLKDWSIDRDDEVADGHFDPNEETYVADLVEQEPQCRLRRFDPGAPKQADIEAAHSAGEVRLAKLDKQSAELEFPADRLRCPIFRSSLPPRCMRCQGRSRLSSHLVIFSTDWKEQVDLVGEHLAGELILGPQELGSLRGQELLARLPMVPNVPYPGNLPFPYFVCDKCSPLNLVGGQIRMNTDTGQGSCRLRLANLQMAAEFLATVGGAKGQDLQRLTEALASLKADPWQGLPTEERHRIQQWFRRYPGEAFVAFIPDGDFSRSELGMAGLLVSSRRLVYHRPPRHREGTVDESLVIRLSLRGEKQMVSLDSPMLKNVSMATDPSGVKDLRSACRMAGLRARWG